MKREERIAYEYFMSEGYDTIQYEPDGNVPPDILLNGAIAVEVRRLNQHFKNRKDIPLENLEYQLIPRITNLVKSFQAPGINSSAFLTITYSRPLKVDKDLIADIKTVLKTHVNSIGETKEYSLRENLKIRIWPTKRKLSAIYNIGVLNDYDTGGFIVGIVHQNLKIVVEEKKSKIDPYYKRYKEWWLVLIDRIGFTLSEEEIDQLKSLPIEIYPFKKLILISGFDHKNISTIR
jgi:hypothetical protein